jgi:hypothetical protein
MNYSPNQSKYLTVAQSRTNNGQKDVKIILDTDTNVFYTLDDDNNFETIKNGGESFTGGSASCITDLYITNLHGCSPITIYDSINSTGSTASGLMSFAFGSQVLASGTYSHAEGLLTSATTFGSHAEGNKTLASGLFSHAEGLLTSAITSGSHAEGNETLASGLYSHAEGYQTTASAEYSHAEGWETSATTFASHAEGGNTKASGFYSHAEGYQTTASGYYSHSEGQLTIASGTYSHAEGLQTSATTFGSHAEGNKTLASGFFSHAEGSGTTASGIYSHAEGLATIANGAYQQVIGQYNLTATTQSAFIVGNGTSNLNRSNLLVAANSAVTINAITLSVPFLPLFKDNASAIGLNPGDVYITDGTGAAPLDVAGILMVKI